MTNKEFICKVCKKIFDTPLFYEERHGLDCSPYERVPMCPNCKSNDLHIFNTSIERNEIADKVLLSISKLNCFSEGMSDFFGADCKNSDFCDAVGLLHEIITDLFPFISVGTERQLLFIKNNKDVDRFFLSLWGEL